ncbi:glycosyltransferase [Motilimonas cestriensis]|uniref:glycosyltransferase n=1 Tax=Motilimonas cestriensis TaxID=2742685 RepID=UPI003DA5A3CC
MLKIGSSSVAETVKFSISDDATCIIDDNVEIRDFVTIECGSGGYLHIKGGAIINSHTWINASGKVEIGDNVLIGPNVSITSSSHRYSLTTNIKDQGLQVSEVKIGNDVWIGAGCTLLAGVSIGDSCILAANSVVKFDIEKGAIAAGNPATRRAARQYKTVVFYTLPLVIREEPTLFSSIIDVYQPLIDNFSNMGWRCIVVGSNELMKEYIDPPFEKVCPNTFDVDYPDWRDGDWIERWKMLLKGENLAYHSDFLKKITQECNPSLLFCWNYDGVLKKYCEDLNLPILFNELGLLRSPNPMAYYSDPRGVNTNAGLRHEFNRYKRDLVQLEASKIDWELLEKLEENYLGNPNKDADYVLILLQVQDDSNLIMGSPFSSMLDYVTCISSALADSPYQIIVKPHPLDESPILPNDIFIADKNANTADLVANASAVFTINSSAGYEAALAGKVVYVLGKAPYSGLGITIDVDSPASLSRIWQSNGVNAIASRKTRAQILNFSYEKYFLSPEKFVDPSSHFSRLSDNNNAMPTRKGFIDECEIYRQQASLSILEKDNVRLMSDIGSALTWNEKLSDDIAKLNVNNAELSNALTKLKEEEKQQAANLHSALKKIDEVEHELYLTRQSFSWRVTRPLRFVRRFLSKPKAVTRNLYHRYPVLSPIVSKVRTQQLKLKKFSQSILDSKNNLTAIQALSERRACDNFYFNDSKDLPDIAVSIVTFNSARWVKQFFESLTEQSYPLNKLNILLVDNGSSDNTVEVLEEYKKLIGKNFLGFTIFRGENVGFGAGHDVAIQASDEELVLITNIDLVFTNSALNRVVEAVKLDCKKEVASWELRQAPFEHPKYYDPVTLETNWSSHACILIRKNAYIKVKGYDHKIFMYGEDVELSYRFRSFGYHLKYCPKALVFHYTYEHESQVKPLQYKGSTLANFNLRIRYGDFWDKAAILVLQLGLLSRLPPYEGARKDTFQNVLKFIKGYPHFIRGKGDDKEACFPFRMFDYEMIREGAFYEIGSSLESNPLVSVIVRTYRGRGELLRQAIISILNQTYNSIEIVVVEDGGNTHEAMMEEFSTHGHDNIFYHYLDKVGRSVTGNHGLSNARGEYCMFLDDDDLLFSDHVEVLVSALIDNKESVAAYSLAMEVWTRKFDNQVGYIEEFFHTPEAFKQEFDYTILQDHNFIPIQSILFKRSLYLERGGFEVDMDNLEDWNLWLRYGYDNHFSYVPKTTSLFRTPADNNVRESRHQQLHEAYMLAKDRAQVSCKSY